MDLTPYQWWGVSFRQARSLASESDFLRAARAGGSRRDHLAFMSHITHSKGICGLPNRDYSLPRGGFQSVRHLVDRAEQSIDNRLITSPQLFDGEIQCSLQMSHFPLAAPQPA